MKVESSNIVSIGYDAESSTLEVEFSNDSVYQYYSVEPAVYEALMLAPSKGKYLAENIKRTYAYSRVGE